MPRPRSNSARSPAASAATRKPPDDDGEEEGAIEPVVQTEREAHEQAVEGEAALLPLLGVELEQPGGQVGGRQTEQAGEPVRGAHEGRGRGQQPDGGAGGEQNLRVARQTPDQVPAER